MGLNRRAHKNSSGVRLSTVLRLAQHPCRKVVYVAKDGTKVHCFSIYRNVRTDGTFAIGKITCHLGHVVRGKYALLAQPMRHKRSRSNAHNTRKKAKKS